MFFDRPDSGELAILVQLDIYSEADGDSREFEELAISAGACPVEFITGSRQQIAPRYFVGTGKLEEIAGDDQSPDCGRIAMAEGGDHGRCDV